jgi:hypothetical protein
MVVVRLLIVVGVAALVLSSACDKKNTGPTPLPDTEFKTAPVPSKDIPPEQAFVQYRRKDGPELVHKNSPKPPIAVRIAWWENKNGSKTYRVKVCYSVIPPWAAWNPDTQSLACRKFDEDREGESVPYPIDTEMEIWVLDEAFSPVRRVDDFIVNGTLLSATPTMGTNGVVTKFKLNASLKPY